MEITEQTRDVLVVRNSPWTVRGFGAAFAAMGAGALWVVTHASRASIQGSPIVAWVVGIAFIGIGLFLFSFARNERVVFDRKAGVVRLMGRKVTEYPLADVRAVALEAQRGEEGSGLFYRPVLILSDGRHIPWISVATTNGLGQAPAVAAAQAFGGWPSGMGEDAPTAVVVQRTPRGNLIIAQVFLGLFAMIGLAISGFEEYRLMTWQPVPATVMGTNVATVHGNKGGVSYRPQVTYWYRIDGREYVATGVTPIPIAASWNWAQGIVARFRPGAAVTAYVNPSDPSRAFVVREFSPIPLWLFGIGAGLLVLITWTARVNARTTSATGDLGVPVVGVGRSVGPFSGGASLAN